jgi:hypothetical protein
MTGGRDNLRALMEGQMKAWIVALAGAVLIGAPLASSAAQAQERGQDSRARPSADGYRAAPATRSGYRGSRGGPMGGGYGRQGDAGGDGAPARGRGAGGNGYGYGGGRNGYGYGGDRDNRRGYRYGYGAFAGGAALGWALGSNAYGDGYDQGYAPGYAYVYQDAPDYAYDQPPVDYPLDQGDGGYYAPAPAYEPAYDQGYGGGQSYSYTRTYRSQDDQPDDGYAPPPPPPCGCRY